MTVYGESALASADPPDWSGTFHEFWPVTLVRRRLSDHSQANRALVAVIEEMDSARDNLTTRYQGVDFMGMDQPGVNWLRDQVERTVQEYFAYMGMDYPIRWNIQAWPNVNRLGDYHAPHNHAWSYLSGTYYVTMPTNSTDVAVHAAAEPAAITFYDPRATVNMHALKGDPRGAPDYTVRPEPGTLLMWHSSVNHFVHPNLSHEPRITISFNIVLEWANHYLVTP